MRWFCGAVKDLITICSDPYEAANQAHAIIVATEWDEFVVSINVEKTWINFSNLYLGACLDSEEDSVYNCWFYITQ